MVAMTASSSINEAARRQIFREFARRNHPDTGGDPVVFAAGVAAYRAGGLPADADARPLAQAENIVFVHRRRGAFALIDVIIARRRRRRRPPRVR